jgi:hypothetical protein
MSIKSTTLMILVMCAICTFAQAQNAAASQTKAASPASSSCYAEFGQALPSFCVTANGNIEAFYYPNSVSQIYTDGYGVCDFTGSSNVSYYDVGVADSGNWQSPVITEPGGANTFPLTIKRTTSDGVWTITQAYSRNAADAYVKVQITLKNDTAVTRYVQMTRYVDIDADGDPEHNYFDGDSNSGWGYESSNAKFPNHGLTIRSAASAHNWFGYNVPSGDYDPCTTVSNANATGTPFYGDEAVAYLWTPNGGSYILAGKSIAVTLEYRPM